ncbi:GRP family sugar transporter [Listeria fleischmannii]|jgi:glucose uptake protein|uniref:Glucose uptake protein n=3 Tax=Listeria fleischmannii TaxID=1069827 RepID=W7D8F8_9LIST|nr:GRP family sugar transporter [Listeria fleischmannii]EUJ48881.1 glucose uptake protein [Listeria fleischmannii FSL S10-1203]MBC1399002.1 glucose transporter GlcU [Listeria fleischmannii]MBC1419721.1 glucose transporter GlcU [Listeria fleischmannii]MBC1427255.1 glucose transporter GlcU [Listeria fleischmannii]STY34661.1 Putative glucose uptake permease [Listeria fleischmannii subsp. coloradonensis]
MNILVALIPAVMWGLMPLVVSKIGGKPKQQIIGTAVGAFIFAVFVFFFTSPHYTATIIIASFISGAFWSLGQMNQFRAFTQIGVSKTMPLSTGMQLVGTSLFGVFAFHEWGTTSKLVLGFSALGLIIIGIFLTSFEENKGQDASQSMKKGLVTLFISSVGYVGYVVVTRWFDISGWDAILPQAIGMVIGAFVLSMRSEGKRFAKQTFLNIIPGVMWATGNLALLFANRLVGVATGFSLSQMGVVISTIGGILFLGEKKTKKELIFVVIGVILVIIGGTMIGFAKS